MCILMYGTNVSTNCYKVISIYVVHVGISNPLVPYNYGDVSNRKRERERDIERDRQTDRERGRE